MPRVRSHSVQTGCNAPSARASKLPRMSGESSGVVSSANDGLICTFIICERRRPSAENLIPVPWCGATIGQSPGQGLRTETQLSVGHRLHAVDSNRTRAGTLGFATWRPYTGGRNGSKHCTGKQGRYSSLRRRTRARLVDVRACRGGGSALSEHYRLLCRCGAPAARGTSHRRF